MEGAPVDRNKTSSDPIADALRKIEATRARTRENPPEWLEEDKRERAAPPPTTVEPPEHARKQRKILQGAMAHDLHQRKLLGEDF